MVMDLKVQDTEGFDVTNILRYWWPFSVFFFPFNFTALNYKVNGKGNSNNETSSQSLTSHTNFYFDNLQCLYIFDIYILKVNTHYRQGELRD